MRLIGVWIILISMLSPGCRRSPATAVLSSNPPPTASILHFPTTHEGQFPARLSQVGAFTDLASLAAAPGLMAYDVNVPFWSDGAAKRRWIGLPAGGRIRYSRDGEWGFPAGTVFVKHFEIPAHGDQPPIPIETRVLVCETGGNVFGASYKWRNNRSDADLVTDPITAPIPATNGSVTQQPWYFPGVADCRVCHTPYSGGVLGVKTRQINRPLTSDGENQLVVWKRKGLFRDTTGNLDPAHLAHLSRENDPSASVAERARSYLDANCANCHRPGGVAGNFDARYDTPLARQNLIGGPVLIDLGLDAARVISPHDPWRSMALVRVETSDRTRMPPLAHQALDKAGAALLREWIQSMPGLEVLSPPVIEPKGGEYAKVVRVELRTDEAGGTIHYTLDGNAPGKSSPIYSQPIELHEPATLRARVYKDGMTRSIAVQETFVITDSPASEQP